MRLYARDDGSLIAAHPDVDPGDPPVSLLPLIKELPAATFDFDTTTNAALTDDIIQDVRVLRLGRYQIVGGALTKDGVIVTPSPASRFITDKQQVAQFLQTLDADGTITQAQVLRCLRFILRWIVRRG